MKEIAFLSVSLSLFLSLSLTYDRANLVRAKREGGSVLCVQGTNSPLQIFELGGGRGMSLKTSSSAFGEDVLTLAYVHWKH